MRRYGLSCFIGRFSPPHMGHRAVIEQALVVADVVLIAIGSANAPRRYDYVPFTAQEREAMIRLMFSAEDNLRIRFVHVEDKGNMPAWTGAVREAANAIEPDDKKITLIGHAKDNSSFYLKGFPGWAAQEVDNYLGLSATPFRNWFFSQDFDAGLLSDFSTALSTEAQMWKEAMHPEVTQWLIDFSRNSPIYRDDVKAYDHLREEKLKCEEDVEKYGRVDPDNPNGKKVYGPYAAADALYVWGDYVLVIERGGHPYKGCMAFPGGFIEIDEDVVEAAIRESKREESKVKIPERAIRNAYVTTQHFAAPFRDPRGRVYSFASLFHFEPQPPADMTDPADIAKFLAPPRVKAGDDARKAYWKLIKDCKVSNMAFDHYLMLQRMLTFLPQRT